MRIKIFNYRNIPHGHPLEFEIKDGISFIRGPNNVGKSNLLKFFYELRPIFSKRISGNEDYTNFNIKLPITYDQFICRISTVEDEGVVFEITNDHGYTSRYNLLPVSKSDWHDSTVSVSQSITNCRVGTTESRTLMKDIFDILSRTIFSGVFRTPEMVASGNSFDLEIGSSFINNWTDWADSGNIQKMNKVKCLKEELRQIFNYERFEIRTSKERNNLIISNDDGEFMLSELGSGIGQVILLLSKAMMSSPSFILIDEPENSLHPKMQEAFVRALASKAINGLLATSHSVGLARSVADNIYTLTKENNIPKLGQFGQHFIPTIAQSINEMGYSQFVEIGGNNILLVEGRTDVKVFREVLRKYGVENKFIIISLGGGEFLTNDETKIIEELNEIKRLNPKSINVIFDSEKTSEDAELKDIQKNFKRVCENLGFRVFATDRHSTENYLSQYAIRKVIGDEYRALKPFEPFKTLGDKKWPKEKNWLIVNEMSIEDFTGTELDLFIKEVLITAAN